MAKVVQPAVAADEIVFELERFELVDGRLSVIGRWFGVRGRRFVRPTLTPLGGRDLSRVLADLEHKPWPADAGEPWEAAFPWDRGRGATKFELSVSPDIVIQLPSPSARLNLPRRITAQPRRLAIMPSWRQPAVDEALSEEPDSVELGPSEVEMLGAQLDQARAELEAAQGQLAAMQAQLEAAREELATTAAARDHGADQTEAAVTARDQLRSENDGLRAEGEQLRAARAELESAYAALESAHGELEAANAEMQRALEELSRERDRLSVELAGSERAAAELRSQLDQSAAAVEEAARERDEAITAHGAAMVMRRATRAGSYPAHSNSWWRSALAVLAMIAVVFLILIVAHVL